MMLPDVAAYLQGRGVATVGTNMFLGSMPPSPAVCVALREAGGAPAEWTHQGVAWERPVIQVIVRHTSYSAGRALIEQAYQSLLALKNTTIGGIRYYNAEPMSPPSMLEFDENDRPILVVNVEIWKGIG